MSDNVYEGALSANRGAIKFGDIKLLAFHYRNNDALYTARSGLACSFYRCVLQHIFAGRWKTGG